MIKGKDRVFVTETSIAGRLHVGEIIEVPDQVERFKIVDICGNRITAIRLLEWYEARPIFEVAMVLVACIVIAFGMIKSAYGQSAATSGTVYIKECK
jgi:hypothetical protein